RRPVSGFVPDGRTVSKRRAHAGLRLLWVTAPSMLIERAAPVVEPIELAPLVRDRSLVATGQRSIHLVHDFSGRLREFHARADCVQIRARSDPQQVPRFTTDAAATTKGKSLTQRFIRKPTATEAGRSEVENGAKQRGRSCPPRIRIPIIRVALPEAGGAALLAAIVRRRTRCAGAWAGLTEVGVAGRRGGLEAVRRTVCAVAWARLRYVTVTR